MGMYHYSVTGGYAGNHPGQQHPQYGMQKSPASNSWANWGAPVVITTVRYLPGKPSPSSEAPSSPQQEAIQEALNERMIEVFKGVLSFCEEASKKGPLPPNLAAKFEEALLSELGIFRPIQSEETTS